MCIRSTENPTHVDFTLNACCQKLAILCLKHFAYFTFFGNLENLKMCITLSDGVLSDYTQIGFETSFNFGRIGIGSRGPGSDRIKDLEFSLFFRSNPCVYAVKSMVIFEFFNAQTIS